MAFLTKQDLKESSVSSEPRKESLAFRQMVIYRRDGEPVPFTTEEAERKQFCLSKVDKNYDGIQVVYWKVLDLRRAFPEVPPTVLLINPLTGQNWTASELEAFPRGYPGWPADGIKGREMTEAERMGLPPPGERMKGGELSPTVQERSAIETEARFVPLGVFTLDWSREKLSKFLEKRDDAWNYPETLEDARQLAEIACQACNWTAWKFWCSFRRHAELESPLTRNEAQCYAVTNPCSPPMWIKFGFANFPYSDSCW